jgi:hypothetical protein
MRRTAAARRTTRRTLRLATLVLAVVSAAAIGHLLHQSAATSAASFDDVLRVERGDGSAEVDGAVHDDGGAVPEGVTVYDDEHSGVANLDPHLLEALRDAATDAADDGIELHVESGWRSPEYQDRLLREAISEYGSEAEAARWVATPDTSPHVSGNAVDIGHTGAMAWLSVHGAGYGLCQIYGNEPWHYELRPDAIDRGCPATYADPTHDPRMQQFRR